MSDELRAAAERLLRYHRDGDRPKSIYGLGDDDCYRAMVADAIRLAEAYRLLTDPGPITEAGLAERGWEVKRDQFDRPYAQRGRIQVGLVSGKERKISTWCVGVDVMAGDTEPRTWGELARLERRLA